ncbi:acyl-CoA dehydrogenase [Mycobacterium gordonae]|uniref:Acyl-CoA dehydrogenase n=1 Tax=Mycobacterium gordonae TaxID=1778 RepID=A0A1A6B999_MYCGO|nr:acyl-CoA dehydrogenase family protein [Mycobacterium gordonae]MBI2700891.1 acyl-CoA dehydrogenase family protein [Mycobacterium sp.]MBX9980052.1 acyl-CoA dehydrogenase family protein [Mycobacterium gordonae]MCQ4361617.1 acyl-CoA dehydrogenase family protein [Mycobacterium gordonae]OBR98818.1 acyl-CoA dehydrogenase [Mycobacterium gordonae]
MDFSVVSLSDDDQAFYDRTRALVTATVTEEVRRRNREFGENFDERVHLALGEAGYLASDWKPESEGGFSAVRRRIFNLEIARAHTPWYHWGTTSVVAHLVQQFAAPELVDMVLPGVLSGQVRLCLGYTEPEGGSDVATCKTRAVRDSDGWIINGSKMFTSNAQNARYVFLLTNTDPQRPKHRNLTMFLVPLDSPGIEIRGIRTLDGDRTNIVFYTDVRVDDLYRIGDVNDGWTVMRAALDSEHGLTERDAEGLQDVAAMAGHGNVMAEAVDRVAGLVSADDESVLYRLGRCAARTEAALSTPGMFGRVAIGQTMRDISADLMDLLGPSAALPTDVEGAADDGSAEHLFRLALPMGIYGGSLEVFRNMIAQHELGLGRPSYG